MATSINYCIGALVLHNNIKKFVLDIQYFFESNSIFPGRRMITYLRLGNEWIEVSKVKLISINNGII
jgi:hypothetical protein